MQIVAPIPKKHSKLNGKTGISVKTGKTVKTVKTVNTDKIGKTGKTGKTLPFLINVVSCPISKDTSLPNKFSV